MMGGGYGAVDKAPAMRAWGLSLDPQHTADAGQYNPGIGEQRQDGPNRQRETLFPKVRWTSSWGKTPSYPPLPSTCACLGRHFFIHACTYTTHTNKRLKKEINVPVNLASASVRECTSQAEWAEGYPVSDRPQERWSHRWIWFFGMLRSKSGAA